MVTATINKAKHRFDDGNKPVVNIANLSSIGQLKLADWQYFTVAFGDNILTPDNKGLEDCKVHVRDTFRPTWVRDSGIDLTSGTGDLQKSGTDGYEGAYYDTALDETNCSIQATTSSTSLSSGISLQDSTNSTIIHDSRLSTVAHSIVFGQNGEGTIRELGSLVRRGTFFKYEFGDTGIIELVNGIVRYYLVKPDNRLILLRTTRSKLTSAPKAEVMLYHNLARLDNIFIFNNDETVLSYENVSVLSNFQDWFNDGSIISTADTLTMADGENEHTFANTKKRIRTLQVNTDAIPKNERTAFIEFFNYHGIEKHFLFIDKARKDLIIEENDLEYFAKFQSAFGDKVRGCLSAHSALIVESSKEEYIPVTADQPPSIPENYLSTGGSKSINIRYAESVDDYGIAYYLIRYKQSSSGTWLPNINNGLELSRSITGLLPNENYDFQLQAVDTSGNGSGWSPTQTLTTFS